MEQRFITGNGLVELLDHLEAQYSIYSPQQKQNVLNYSRYSRANNGIQLGDIRCCEPLKAFFFGARKAVAVESKSAERSTETKPFCILGAKACDLKSLAVLDGVFMEDDYTDPFYADARQNNLIISADCASAADTCFCLALRTDPFPRGSFDLNLSPVKDGYVVEVGSEKGGAVVVARSELFGEVAEAHLSDKRSQRDRVVSEVQDNIRENDIPDQDALKGAIRRNFESELWQEESETCVECGACNVVCPTCHCFLLYDQRHEGESKRFRLWDSCLIKDFAEVAGGANPRPHLWMRLRNRFEKKFDYFPAVKNLFACTGCGRCINACPGKIDIRHVLKRNVEHVPN